MSDRIGEATERPACASECKAVLLAEWARACGQAGVPVAEAHITHVAPLIPSLYKEVRMTCPHGVTWHMQPTSEQIAAWVRDGVE